MSSVWCGPCRTGSTQMPTATASAELVTTPPTNHGQRERAGEKSDTDADNEDEVYKDGVEVDDSEAFGTLEKIKADFPIECVCSRGDYVLSEVEFDGQAGSCLQVKTVEES